jgi:uncharacterized protein
VGEAMPLMPHLMLPPVIAVLLVANVLNNRVAPWAYVCTCLVTTGILLLLLRSAHPNWDATWAAAGLGANTLRRGLVWGLAPAAVVAVGYLLLTLHPATREFLLDRRAGVGDWQTIAYQALVRVPLGTVLLEEVAFRGVLYGLVRTEHGAVSSLLFGLWHILPSLHLGDANPAIGQRFGDAAHVTVAAVVTAVGGGVLLCELRRISDSLLAPAALHWATNGLGYLVVSLVIQAR